MHGTKVDLHLKTPWDPISVSFFYIGSHWPLGTDLLGIRMPLVNTTTTPQLLRLVEPGMLDIGSLVTHRMFA